VQIAQPAQTTRSVLFVLLLLCAAAAPTARARGADRPPNVLVILSDDLGYADLGCYGAPQIKTPRLDRLAGEGMRFTDFYAAANVCTPSRAALLTGCYPQRVSLGEVKRAGDANSSRVLYSNSPYGLNPDEITLAEIMKSRGYATGMVGKWHLGDAKEFLPTRQGFDSYFGIPYSNDMTPLVFIRGEEVVERDPPQASIADRYTEESIAFIKKNRDKPFFLYLAHNAPHTPIDVPPAWRGKSAGGLYGDVVEHLDHNIGRVLDTLADEKLAENTLVIFTSDNGPWHIRGEQGGNATPLRAGKGTTYEGGMRVPCIVRWPAKIPAASVCRELATQMDLYPSLAAIAEAKLPTDRIIDGKEITDLLFAKPGAKSPHDAFFYYSGNRLSAVRAGEWKLKLRTTLQEETEYGKIDNPQTPIEPKLYNLLVDPGEQKSVLKDHPEIVARLNDLAARAREDLGDARMGVVGKNVRPVGER
jgi:arylsulfatase A-like enzyme